MDERALPDDEIYEIYYRQVKSRMIGESGAAIIRTKGLRRGQIVCALYLAEDKLPSIEPDELEDYIYSMTIGLDPTFETEVEQITIENRSIEVATFSQLDPGSYIFWPDRISVPVIIGASSQDNESEEVQSHYAYKEIIPGQLVEIDWRYLIKRD